MKPQEPAGWTLADDWAAQIRICGSPDACAETARRLGEAFDVRSQSPQQPSPEAGIVCVDMEVDL